MSKRYPSAEVVNSEDEGEHTSDNNSNVDNDQSASAKKQKINPAQSEPAVSSPKKNDDGDTYFELSAKRRITMRKWKDTVFVDIREFWTDPAGNTRPGKKGISLSAAQWESLKQLMPAIDDHLAEL
ncbi:hypothetical protein H4R35_003650 [Dimargaris xerosporica]|nr:hypothetical protein H4R35_003650 [Dimargaris xerosporica]